MSDLTGRRAIVFGGRGPLLDACVDELRRAGATVLVADPSASAPDVAVADAAAGGALHIACNVAPAHAVDQLLHEGSEDDFDRAVEADVRTLFRCMRAELRHLAGHGGGALVNVGSAAGLAAIPRRAVLDATMHAVVGLTRTAALEFGPLGVRANVVCPGPEQPGATPLGRAVRPHEVGVAVAWLCSDEASFVNGVALPVDGGLVETEGQLQAEGASR